MKRVSPPHADSTRAALAQAQPARAQALAVAVPFNAGQAPGQANAMSPPRGATPAQLLTTHQGVAIDDNQNPLKAGLRGPTLMEDVIPRRLRRTALHWLALPVDGGIHIGPAAKADGAAADFIAARGRRRHPEREAGALAP